MGTVFAAADTALTKCKKLSDCPVDRLDPKIAALAGHSSLVIPRGKGANQAVACALQGT
jgi:hypothetical protein